MAERGIYDEWRTTNAQRRYPFADDATLLGSEAGQLSDSAFVDAMFYPTVLSGRLRLSAVLFSKSIIVVSDDSGEVASAKVDFSSEDTIFFEDTHGRVIGCMVPGPGFSRITGDMNFEPGSAEFSQSCVIAQNHKCVTAFRLPDSTVVSGEVVFEGENGVTVTTEYELDGTPVLRFDAVGVPETPNCLPLNDPITCIKVSQVGSGGALMISQVENIIMLGTPYILTDVCDMFKKLPDADGSLPMSRDMCLPPVPPVPCDPPEPFEGACPVISYSTYYLWAIADTIGVDMVSIDPVFTEDSLQQNAGASGLPSRPKQGLRLFLKGVPTNV